MSLALYDRVRETTTVLGTNDAVLLGAVTGYQSFAAVGNTNTCYYTISDNLGNWEVGLGTYSTTGPTLARTTVYSSSNSNLKVNFPAGTKDIFLTYPSEKAVALDTASSIAAGSLLYGNGTTSFTSLPVGSNTYILQSNGSTPTWVAPSSITGGAGGSNTQVQYNNSGALAGSANMTFNGTSLTLANVLNAPSVNGATTLTLATGGTTAVTVDASQNVGVGVTPNAWASPFKVIEGGNATYTSALAFQTNVPAISLWSNAYYDGARKYKTSGNGACEFIADSGTYTWRNAGSGTAGSTISFLQPMVLDTSGRLLIGNGLVASGSDLLQVNSDALVNGLTVGLGGGAQTTNTTVGNLALNSNTTSGYNTAIGSLASYGMIGNSNTSIGAGAMQGSGTTANNTGAGNTALGVTSLYGLSSGSYNTALGQASLFSNTTASNNTAVGYQAGYSNTTGGYNTALGTQALYSITSTSYNTAVGYGSMINATAGSYNCGIGSVSLYSNQGDNNTAIGYNALKSNTTASNNTAVGYQAGYSNTTGAENTFLGYQAGYSSNPGSVSARNVCVGIYAGYNLTTGVYNTLVGGSAPGSQITSGSNNTIIGGFSGNQNGLNIATASNYIVLSDGAGNPRQVIDNNGNALFGATAWGYAGNNGIQIQSQAGNNAGIFIGDSASSYLGAFTSDLGTGAVCVSTINNVPLVFKTNGNNEAMRVDTNQFLLIGYTTSNGAYKLQVNSQIFATSSTIATSDQNYKTNVTPITNGLDIINKLNPVSFDWKQHVVHDFDTENTTVGFLAQEVQVALADTPFVNSVVKESEVTLPDGEKESFLGIAEGNLIAILTKAIQELSAKNDALEARLAALEAK